MCKKMIKVRVELDIFEPELALLVRLQVLSSKEGGGREEGGRTF